MNQIVIITPEEYLENEIEAIGALSEHNIRIHLRKPYSSAADFDLYVQRVMDNCSKEKISIHKFHSVADNYNLAKHYSFDVLKETDYDVRSCSVHSLEEAKIAEDMGVEYYFLSPIFDSISKSGYCSKFQLADIEQYLSRERQSKCVALGGVSIANIADIRFFDSIALLGGVWSIQNSVVDIDKTVIRFKEIERAWRK